MNKRDRKELEGMFERLVNLATEVDALGDSERDKYDNLTEGLQATAQGERFDEVAELLSEQAGVIQDAANELAELL